MDSVHGIEKALELPPVHEMIEGRPTSWLGEPLTWLSDARDPVPVYITRFAVAADGRELEILLFGARYDVAEVLVGGKSYGHGHFVEYFVVHRDGGGPWRLRRLLQRGGVPYSESSEQGDPPSAREVSDPERRSVGHPPVWDDLADALWPTAGGELMTFVGQVGLPETEVTRTQLTWNTTVYVFWAQAGDEYVFKIIEQEPE